MANKIRILSSGTPVVEKSGVMLSNWFRVFQVLFDRVAIIDGDSTVSASVGTASLLPVRPAGYMSIILDGKTYKLPYYNI